MGRALLFVCMPHIFLLKAGNFEYYNVPTLGNRFYLLLRVYFLKLLFPLFFFYFIPLGFIFDLALVVVLDLSTGPVF